jgi:3-polyprenyl-4-hydroxybenzoate decarboxylase
MLALSRMGAIIFPPIPAFYNRPGSIDQIVDHIVGRVLDQFGLDMPGLARWSGF